MSQSAEGVNASFPATRRLKRRDEFSLVFSSGKVAADRTLVVHAVRSDSSQTRLGLSISKKVGHAPCRNRWKRLIREAFRLNLQRLPTQLLLVVRPRRGAVANLPAIQDSLLNLTQQLDRKLSK